MKSVLMFQFLLVFSSGICWAADKPAPLVKPSFPEKREMKYMFEHTLRREKSEDYIQVRLVLPQTEAGRQTIRRLKITPKQHRTIQEGDTKIAVWDWKSPDPVKIRIEVNADIYHHSLRSLLKNPPRRYHRLKINDRKGFLRPEKYQEVDDPLIIAEAEKIAQGVDDKETVLNILTHVTEILQNGGWSKGDLGAKVALEQGFGDCTEFSDLMVALCRAKGIPARSRLCIIPRTIDTPLHAIMEAYIPQLGWVTFDPLWTEDTHSEADVLPNRYLTFRIARNDEHLFNFFTPKAYWIFSENKVFDFKTRLEVSNRDESGEWIMKEFTF